ncbi:hypothetical protein CCR75_004197 [Bremia lactucae]|uniref:Serine-threonine/tyrosine-protein kinase catalytic domain-containing protein n=1 Tax=Bremia lactucae TaxID=4779 RepID=A0A976FJP2_BRELC|nr:hypothetical protein CCR75_004197 [Bremia lactucae]
MDGDKPSDSIVVPKATKSTIIAMPTTPVSSQDLPTTKTISTIKTRTSSAHSNANSSRNMTQSVTDGSTDNNATIIPPTINGNEASSFETIIGTNNNNHSTDVAASANTVTASESDTNTIAEPIASGTDISQLPSFSAAVSTPIEDIAPSSTTITDSAIIVPTTPEENTFRTSEPPLSNNNSHTTVTTPTNVVPNTISSTAATNTIASSIEAQATDNTTPKSTNILVATLSHNTIMHSTSTSPPSSSSTNASISLSNWFLNTFRLDDTQLLVRSPISISHEICAGLPALITRSNTIPSNKNCPDTLSTLNASCTCLTGYNPKATTSVIHVTSNVPSRTQNWTQTLTSPLPITALRPLHLSSSTKTLVLQGVDASYASITFLPERTRSNSSRPLVHQAKNLTTLALYNVDLHSIALESSNFIPSTVTNLTLRHCNLTTLPLSFTSTWTAVQHLDLSQNHLHSAYTGGPALKTLNLSYNSLETFPTDWIESSPLQALYLQGNALQDLNITHTIYKRIQALRAFQADPPPVSSTCPLGAWQAVHGVTFCVLHASTAAVPDTSASSGSSPPESSTSFGVLSYWLLAGTLAVFLMLLFFVYQRRRKYFERASSPMLSPVEPMTPRIHAGTVFRDALNHDTVVPVVHGAVYHDYGRSNTSSTVSDETYATVGASLYHRFSEDCPSTILELATRCLRADPEERPRASEIVVYLQNLIRARPSQSFESSAISSIVTVVPQPVSSRISGHSPITTSTVNQASWNATSSSTVQSNQALLSTHEMVAISPQVTRQVLRTTLPYKHKRTTRNTTRREESYSTNQNTGTHASTTEGANRVRPFRLERNRTVTRRNDGECNPTSPSY